jgi:hypothetical protein
MQGTIERLEKQLGDSRKKEDDAVGERGTISKRLQDTEGQLTTTEILNEGLRKDKNRVINYTQKREKKITQQFYPIQYIRIDVNEWLLFIPVHAVPGTTW